MGIRTIAIHSDADSRAMHVENCDVAVRIGPPPATDSYLRADQIIEAARTTGADAIHPGYGFLSENANFANACEKAGMVFVGPPATAIEAMGSKAQAKIMMKKAGVPLVPGYHGADQRPDHLAFEADRIGYPVILKASAGGGGRGMRVVEGPNELAAAIESAKRESANTFGHDRLLIEKYLERPRHVEIQIFADSHGNAIHLFERDCSVQRRHQKVLEEAPAPALDKQIRATLGSTAVSAARAVDYVGAGTVEFMLDESGFYFIEMNTRLQVEHPVTELITGALQDLRVVQTGEVVSADDAALGLSRLNDWINTLATERLSVYTLTRTTWTLVAGTASYTIGTGATVNIARPTGPLAIENIGFQDTAPDTTIEYNLGPPLTEDAYDAIAQKTLTSTFPQVWYYNPTYDASGYGVLIPYPIPTSTTLEGVIYSLTPVSEFTAVTDTIALPPGYRRFLRTGLALELSSAFDAGITPALQQAASESKADIKRANMRLSDMSSGVAGTLFGGAGWPYNIFSDT